jgi:NAD-dependent deacetylase
MLGTMDEDLERARVLLRAARAVVVLTGAGISTDSGIPDFRGPEGVWTKDPGAEMLSTYDVYVADPEVRRRAWQARLTSPTWQARPNAGHRALVELERRGILDTLITQNIDGLHTQAGTDPSKLVEIHGNGREAICLRCGHRQSMNAVLGRVEAGDPDPSCEEPTDHGLCGGILKSTTISFGQSLRAEDLARAEQAALRCDVLLAVGSTLAVYPVANVVPMAQRSGASIIILNGEETAMDALATVLLRGDISATLPALVEQ